jgi:hypothetical protein
MNRFLASVIFLFCLINVSQIWAQDYDPDESSNAFEVLDIRGIISNADDGIPEVLVELYENNKVVDSFETKKNGKFKFTLMNDEIYTIQLTKGGYYTKRISVNTKIPREYDDIYFFEFDINIDSMEEKNYDVQLVEYPSALIGFDQEKEEFASDKVYTKTYFAELEIPLRNKDFPESNLPN